MMTKIFLRKEEKKKICARKASVIDLLNILDNDLWRAGYGRFVWCFCICCMHWVIHKVSRAIAKRKEHSLSFPEYLKYTKRKSNKKVNILLAFENYCTPDYPCLLFFFVTFASFLRITSTSLRGFSPLVFLVSRICKSCSFLTGASAASSIVGCDLIHFPFDTVWITDESAIFAMLIIVVSYIFLASKNSFPNAAIKSCSSLLKLVV